MDKLPINLYVCVLYSKVMREQGEKEAKQIVITIYEILQLHKCKRTQLKTLTKMYTMLTANFG